MKLDACTQMKVFVHKLHSCLSKIRLVDGQCSLLNCYYFIRKVQSWIWFLWEVIRICAIMLQYSKHVSDL